MNFTSIDPPQVVRFVRREYPDVVTHSPEKSIFRLAVEHGILPSMRIRWCCADLKETAGAGKVTLIGIRKQESARRARRKEVEITRKKFSGSLDDFFQWQAQQIAEKEKHLLRKMQRAGKKINEDEFSSQKESEIRCINGKDSILISPIFEWSEQDVWYFLNEVVRVPHCELYDQGYHRIGCILCPMSSYRSKIRDIQDFPHVKRNWLKAIKEIRAGVGEGNYGGTLSDWQWKYHDGTKLPPPNIRRRKDNTGIWAGFNIPKAAIGRGFPKTHLQVARWMGIESRQRTKSPKIFSTGGLAVSRTKDGTLINSCKGRYSMI